MMVIVMGFVAGCNSGTYAQAPATSSAIDAKADSVDSALRLDSGQASSPRVDNILKDLHNAVSNLKSYQCRVEYLFSQPVLDSKTLRTGTLYYARFGGGSKLRIDFDTLSQDDGPQQKYVECYMFDGQWLTHIDYQIKQVQKRQLAEASAAGETSPKGGNEPIDAFELAKRNFPIIGFSKTDDLKKEFDVNLVNEPNGLTHLHLTVKQNSKYKDDYKSVEVWIDTEKSGLPDKITTTTTNGDIYEIKFASAKANEAIDEKVFEFIIPDGFGVEITPFKESKKKSDQELTQNLELN
jgi:outer membrane lipoprotein-sorting protein